jgi:DNA primase
VLERTRPLIDMLWERETGATPLATPEQRAALQAKLQTLSNTIADPLVRQYYERELRDRLYALGRPAFRPQAAPGLPSGRTVRGSFYSSGGPPAPDWRQRERARLFGDRNGRLPRRPEAPQPPSAELASLSTAVHPREALILKAILNHPWLIDEHAEALADLPFSSHALSALRGEILNVHAVHNSLDSATLRHQLSKTGVSKVVDLVERTITHRSDRFAEPEASAIDVETGWRHVLALHQRQGGLERSLKAAEEAWYRDCTPEAEARLLDLKRQLALLGSMEHADSIDVTDPRPGGAEKQAS